MQPTLPITTQSLSQLFEVVAVNTKAERVPQGIYVDESEKQDQINDFSTYPWCLRIEFKPLK